MPAFFSTSPTARQKDELDRAKAELRTAHDSFADKVEESMVYLNIYMFINVFVCAEKMFDVQVQFLKPEEDLS